MFLEARAASVRPPPAFAPEYADDIFSGGEVQDVLAAFQQEIALAAKYGLEFDFSKCTLYLLAGEGFRGDVSAFQA